MDIIQKGKKQCVAEQATSHDDGVFSMTLSPILDNLSSSYVPDPSHLIVPDCLEVRPPIGMANFKSFKPPLSPKKQHQQRTFDNNNNGLSENDTKALIKARWRDAARKIKLLKDPWFEFHLESYPVENVIRHRYNPVKKEWHKDKCVVRMENKEFAHGAMRACYRLKKLSNFSHHKSWDHASNYVAKCYMDKEIPRDRYFQDVRLQMDAKLWAELYNRQNPPKKIDIFQMSILEFVDRADSPLFHLEHYIEGKYIKYNSNAGFVEDIHLRNTPHAFSHFTFEISNHELIVVDIQGVGDLYTDPQIHTSKGVDYGDGNLGVKGFALFFYSHICNDLCKSLGLTEFDLAPSEIQSHDKIVDTMKKKSFTKCRNRSDELISNHCHNHNGNHHPNGVNMSARQRYLINRLTSVDDSNDLLFEIDENDHGSNGFTPQSPGMCYSPGNLLFMGTQNSFNSSSSLLNFNFLSANAKAYYANNSNNTSIIDSPFDNEDAARFYTSNAFNKPRASGVMAEKYTLLNADSEYRRSIVAHCPFESILGKIHLELCKYHELGRFLRDEHDTIDYNAAFFHLVQAANLGVIEALVNLAKIYMQLPHDILPEYHVDENDTNYDNGFEFMQEAAEKGELSALYYVAKAYDTGLGLSKHKQIDWNKAIEYYRKIISESCEETKGLEDAGAHDISTDTEPVYTMIARIAEIYMLGKNGVEKNPSEAADLFTEAADRAMQSGNGRCANKYYDLAEKASAEITVNEN